MTTYLPILCVFLPVLLYGAYLLMQAERRQERIAQRKAKRAHDDSVRKDYGYYNRASFMPMMRPLPYLHPYECLNDDTRPIPTIDAENADMPLSDVWLNAIEGLEIE